MRNIKYCINERIKTKGGTKSDRWTNWKAV